MKRDVKEFFRPTFKKIIVSGILILVLFIGTLYLFGNLCCEQTSWVGLPVPFYTYHADPSGSQKFFSYLVVALDVVLLYLLSCVILYRPLRKSR